MLFIPPLDCLIIGYVLPAYFLFTMSLFRGITSICVSDRPTLSQRYTMQLYLCCMGLLVLSARVHKARDLNCPLCSKHFKFPFAITRIHVKSGGCHDLVRKTYMRRVSLKRSARKSNRMSPYHPISHKGAKGRYNAETRRPHVILPA
jgi:hypothetical protein